MSLSKYALGELAVPSSDPSWNYNDPDQIWERDHFLICIKAGLKAARQKVISYARISVVTQEPNEHPITFLEKSKEALQKFTKIDRLLRGTGYIEGQIPVPVCFRYKNKATEVTITRPNGLPG